MKNRQKRQMNGRKISAIDLFCGAGGLTHGFEQAGFPIIAGYDIDPDCQFPYTHNNKARFILKNIKDVSGAELGDLFSNNDIKVLVGCAPCQPFSTYSQRYEKQKSKGEKWILLGEFVRLIKECNPEIISMENVIMLKTFQVFQDFIHEIKELKYFINFYEVNCHNYGIPQTRKRLLFFGSKFGEVKLIPETHNQNNFETVRGAIGYLEPLTDGQISLTDCLHRASKLSELNLRRIRASKPGGTWRDWPKDLIAECHAKKTGKTYPSVYGRMEWDSLAPTITTQCYGYGNGRFGHPEQDRAISLREAALLQTFPPDYEFVNFDQPVIFNRVGRLIGNAVPVKLGQVIAQSILDHIEIKY